MQKKLLLSLWLFLSPLFCMASPSAFTLQGQIIKPNGEVLEENAVSFKIQLYSPAPDKCLLFEEYFASVNMANSKGLFTLPVGTGMRTGTDFEDTSNLDAVIKNTGGAITPTTCLLGGPTYTPGATDQRFLKMSFDDGTGEVTLAQDHVINSVPYAQYARSLEGLGAVDVLQVNGTTSQLTQANLESIFFAAQDVTDLRNLIDGTNTDYMASAPSAAVGFNNQRISGVAAPSAATDATNKNYVDTTLAGQAINTGVLGAGNIGEVLAWDGVKWIAQTTGGGDISNGGNTFAGAVTLGSNDGFGLFLETNNTPALTIDTGQGVSLAAGLGVTGGIVSGGAITNSQASLNPTSTIDFATGNLQYTNGNCGTFNLHNMKDGGSYSFSVKGLTSATCSFNAFSDGGITALTVHLPPDHGATSAATHTFYSAAVMGADVYFAWVPGY